MIGIISNEMFDIRRRSYQYSLKANATPIHFSGVRKLRPFIITNAVLFENKKMIVAKAKVNRTYSFVHEDVHVNFVVVGED